MDGLNHYRTIWFADTHLGTRDCQVEVLRDFLRHNESDYLYLAGDIIDGRARREEWFWDQRHNDVVQEVLRKACGGTHVVYVPGDHDGFARDLLRLSLGGISIQPHAIHTTADNQQFLVLHGEAFDGVVRYANAGDWIDSCTALVEHASGRLEIVRWKAGSEAPGANRRAGTVEGGLAHILGTTS